MMIRSGYERRSIPQFRAAGLRGADILNPAAGTSLNCGLLAGGIFNSACWCAQFPSLCLGSNATPADVAAASAAANNPSIYAPNLIPEPRPPVDVAAYGTTAAPYTVDQFNAAISQDLGTAKGGSNLDMQAYYDQIGANVGAATYAQPGDGSGSGFSLTTLLLVAAGGVLLFAVMKR